ncbi:MAG: hypothetical protein RJQ00_05520 [Vicingaceae bacterium]
MKFSSRSGISSLPIIILLCLTLGLAPFKPEPHVWQKLKWLFDGGVGMQAMDYFDLLLHGFPWVLLLIFITHWSFKRLK